MQFRLSFLTVTFQWNDTSAKSHFFIVGTLMAKAVVLCNVAVMCIDVVFCCYKNGAAVLMGDSHRCLESKPGGPLFLHLSHQELYWNAWSSKDLEMWSYWVMVGMLRDLFMMSRTSTSGRLSCLVCAQPSSATAMCRSKRRDTDFLRSLGFPLKKEPSHCLITLSIFSVLQDGEGKRDEQWRTRVSVRKSPASLMQLNVTPGPIWNKLEQVVIT